MGFFDWVSRTAKKAVKGIKRAGGKLVKGVKSAGSWLGKRGEELKELGNIESLKGGLTKAGKILQEPQKWVERHDPLKKAMGDWGGFSPISIASGIATAIPSGLGYFTQMSGDKKLQDKLKSGDAGTIMDTAFAGLGVIPLGAVGSGVKAVGRGGRAVARGIKGVVKGSKILR